MRADGCRVAAAVAVITALTLLVQPSHADAGGDGPPDTASIEAMVLQRRQPHVVALAPTSSAATLANGATAAVLAAELLLTPVCASDQCQDGNGPCKRCAQPVSTGTGPVASDALTMLRAAVGQVRCAACVCDVDTSGAITSTDALFTLRRAVGNSVTLDCPPG